MTNKSAENNVEAWKIPYY